MFDRALKVRRCISHVAYVAIVCENFVALLHLIFQYKIASFGAAGYGL